MTREATIEDAMAFLRRNAKVSLELHEILPSAFRIVYDAGAESTKPPVPKVQEADYKPHKIEGMK